MKHFMRPIYKVIFILSFCLLAACHPKQETNQLENNAVSEKQEDVIENESSTETKSTEEIIEQKFEPNPVRDISEIRKMKSWLEYFYYNNLFDEGLDNQTGNISEDTMINFAVSYIMQLEHEGLKFDTDTFRLYIPKEKVEEIALRFFDKIIETHHSISKHGILFENNEYIIQASARSWPTRLDVLSIIQTTPNTYTAILNGNNTEMGEIDHQIKAEFKKIEDRYILVKYQMITNKEEFTTGNPLDLGNGSEPDPDINSPDDFNNPGDIPIKQSEPIESIQEATEDEQSLENNNTNNLESQEN